MPRSGYDCTGSSPGTPSYDATSCARNRRSGGSTPRATTPRPRDDMDAEDLDATPRASRNHVRPGPSHIDPRVIMMAQGQGSPVPRAANDGQQRQPATSTSPTNPPRGSVRFANQANPQRPSGNNMAQAPTRSANVPPQGFRRNGPSADGYGVPANNNAPHGYNLRSIAMASGIPGDWTANNLPRNPLTAGQSVYPDPETVSSRANATPWSGRYRQTGPTNPATIRACDDEDVEMTDASSGSGDGQMRSSRR